MRDEYSPPLSPPRCANLQQVLDVLTELFAAGEIDGTLLRDGRSAILRYSGAAGKHPSKIKANIADLLTEVDEEAALKAGIEGVNWKNLKSLLRKTLNLAGNPTKPARRDRPLSPEWERFLGATLDPDVRIRLRPFAGYCTDRNIAPPKVREQTFHDYSLEVHDIAKSSNPVDAVKKVRRCWNKLVDEFPDELTFRAHIAIDLRVKAQPIETMPESFRKEMALLRKARTRKTSEEVFRCRPLKSADAVEEFCAVIMRIVAAMHTDGHELSKFTSLRYLVQPEYFQATIRALKRQAEVEDLNQLGSYVSVIHWLAETWVKLGTGKLKKLKQSMAIVGRRRAEISDSSLDVLEQLDDKVKRDKLTKLGDVVFAEFRSKGLAATKKDAETLRNALFWELGLTTGWRPSSRARINIDDDIKWTGKKGRQMATLTAGKETEKTELRLKVELPPSTSNMLRYFIDVAVPLLQAKGDTENPHLFPGRHHGKHATTTHLSEKSEKLIARRTHVVGVTAHKSRHVAVKVHLMENPGDWETVQEHVGHRDPNTTKTFYANVTQVASSNRVHKSLKKR